MTKRQQEIDKKYNGTISKQILKQDNKASTIKHGKSKGQVASKKRNVEFSDHNRSKQAK